MAKKRFMRVWKFYRAKYCALVSTVMLLTFPLSGYCASTPEAEQIAALIKIVNTIKLPNVEASADFAEPGVIKVEGNANSQLEVADYLDAIEKETGKKVNLRRIFLAKAADLDVEKFTADIRLLQLQNTSQSASVDISENTATLSPGATKTTPFVCLSAAGDVQDPSLETFHWESANVRYDFEAEGKFKRISKSKGGVAQKNHLPILKGDHITKIKVQPYQSDLLIAYESTDGNYGSGEICRFSEQPLKIKWCAEIYGFNVIASLGSDGAAYVGSIGFLGRINLESGKYCWQLSELFDADHTFNLFGIPLEDESAAAFAASEEIFVTKVIVIDKKTGELLHTDNQSPIYRYVDPCKGK